MSSKYLFTITTGRSGTVYLTDLLKRNLTDACIFHERMGFQSLGVNTPDASHFTLFNSVGNTEKVQAFWQQKFDRDVKTPNEWYIETSHFLSKAGLMENIHLLKEHADEIHIVHLRRHVFKTFWSYVNRFDFFNVGFTWLFTLDPRYPKKIIDSKPFLEHGMYGIALWYVMEMRCRAEYYKQIFSQDPSVHFHTIDLESIIQQHGAAAFLSQLMGEKVSNCELPSRQNETKEEFFGEKEREYCLQLVKRFKFNPSEIAKAYIKAGFRL